MGAVAGWFGRKAVVYVLLVLALLVAGVGWPWARQLVVGTGQAERRALALEQAASTMAGERARAMAGFSGAMRQGRNRTVAQLDSRLDDLRAERDALIRAIAAAPPRWRLALQGSEAVLTVERQRLRLAWVEQEIVATNATRAAVASNGAVLTVTGNVKDQVKRSKSAIALCRRATGAERTFEANWRWRSRSWFENDAHKALEADRETRCKAAEAAVATARASLASAQRKLQARAEAGRRLQQASALPAQFGQFSADLRNEANRARTEWKGRLDARVRLWSKRAGLRSILRVAALLLAGIIVMPFLIRLVCYGILAPIAMRRPAVALRGGKDGGAGGIIPPADPSRTSVPVRLAPGEELLVRQSYLQTESDRSSATTTFLLDWRHPLTSIATGLVFLTRVRGTGETTTVSTTRDPFAEVTIVTLPEHTACVLHPRALAAVAKPVGRPLRVETQWRLTSLHAWLTLQLRYVVFHGPARLVVKGGRGVRVERAESGRVFGPDQLVGFSTDLAYSVTRTRTFWPYFFGREPLLKDRVAAGGGVLIVEEAPLSARTGEVRRGLEGLIDAGMKVFGM